MYELTYLKEELKNTVKQVVLLEKEVMRRDAEISYLREQISRMSYLAGLNFDTLEKYRKKYGELE